MSDFSKNLYNFDQASTGKDLREPIASILDICNESAGDVNFIVDDAEPPNKYGPSNMYTENQVYKIFTDIKNSKLGSSYRIFLQYLPKTSAQRKMALESKRIYSEFLTMDKILDLILG